MKDLFYKKIVWLLCFFQLLSCAGSKDRDKQLVFGNQNYADSFVSSIQPKWFAKPKRFSLVTSAKEPSIHRFFDVKPFRSIEQKTINVVVTTPEGSEFINQIDLSSGQIFTDKKVCSQDDEYKKYNSSVGKPNFSIGVLPRVLDQLNLPQKVIIFGAKDYISKHYKTNYFDVRVVGGYIEQICPHGGCFDADKWLSRLVLVGVQNNNPEFKKIKSIVDIQKKYEWDYSVAFIQNGEGKNIISDKFFPRKRMGAIVSSAQALSFLNRNSTIFTIDKLKEMRRSCYKLYDFLWKDLSYVNAGSKVAKTKKEIRQKALLLQEKKKEGIRDLSFSRRFIHNFKKFNEQYKTCVKYVYPSNINDDAKRHWFFSYLTAFHKLHELGYAFSCQSKSWNINPLIAKNKRVQSLQDQFRNCSGNDLDSAFEYAPVLLDNLRKKNKLSYRYIDYDKGSSGTHMKIYNWTKVSGAKLSCSDEDDMNFGFNKSIFPKDIRWEKRGSGKKKKNSKGMIIY